MNLYNKLYKAVNEGIQKALLIDPEQNDISINYSYHKINNKPQLISFFINEIIENRNVEDNYNNILKIYANDHITYKVNNLNELNIIFNNINKCISTDNIDLSWIDTSNAILVFSQYDENEFFSLHQYSKNTFKYLDMLKIMDNMDNPLYLYRLDCFSNIKDKWHSDDLDYELLTSRDVYFNNGECISKYSETMSDPISGDQHTYKNLNINDREFDNHPAFDWVTSQRLDNDHFRPYLPSISELMVISECQNLINYIFKLMDFKDDNDLLMLGNKENGFTYTSDNEYWSSTEKNKFDAYYIVNGRISYQNKTNESRIIPLWKKIR